MGLTLTTDHALTVVAPLGLDDLIDLRLRHNPARTNVEQFMRGIPASTGWNSGRD